MAYDINKPPYTRVQCDRAFTAGKFYEQDGEFIWEASAARMITVARDADGVYTIDRYVESRDEIQTWRV